MTPVDKPWPSRSLLSTSLLLGFTLALGHILSTAWAGVNHPSLLVMDGETLEMIPDMEEEVEASILSRQKRFLLYLPMSLVQFTVLLATPLTLERNRVLIVVLGGQIAFDAPTNLSLLTVQDVSRQSEGLGQPAVFKAAEMMLDQKGIPGRACMLQTVCDLAQTPLHREAGLLEDILHLMLTPSEGSHPDDWRSPEEREYLNAEKIGGEGKDCRETYSECKTSFLEMFTRVMLT